jgi:hypothetical protein
VGVRLDVVVEVPVAELDSDADEEADEEVLTEGDGDAGP